MDHSLIDDEQIIDLYLMGRLDAEREEELEAHLIGCARCTAELELRRSFIGGMRSLGADDFRLAPAPAPAHGRWRSLALAVRYSFRAGRT